MMKVTKVFTITNELGIHARSAAMIVEVSNRYRAKIVLEKNGTRVNAKSILGILTLGCPKGSKIILHAEGIDAEDALEELGKLIEDKFGEN
jgi:phosphocarrier protein HPr